MDAVLDAVLKQIGGGWLLYILAGFYLIDRFGLVKLWAEGRENQQERRASEQTRLAEGQDRLIDNLQEEIEDNRRRRLEDQEAHKRELAELTERLGLRIDEEKQRADALVAALRDEQLTVKRLRHLVGNFGMHVNHLRILLKQNGIEFPRIDWSRFVAEGGDPAEFDLEE